MSNKLIPYHTIPMALHQYLADMMTSCYAVRSTRSSHLVNLLVVTLKTSIKYSGKTFAVVRPRLWNELLTDGHRGCNSVDTFIKNLKTMLFKITLLTFIILHYALLIFCDYVKICISSVDGFTQHVTYFYCNID